MRWIHRLLLVSTTWGVTASAEPSSEPHAPRNAEQNATERFEPGQGAPARRGEGGDARRIAARNRAAIRVCDLGSPAIAKRVKSELALLKFRVKLSRDPNCSSWQPEERSAVVTVGRGRTRIGFVGRSGTETADLATSEGSSPEVVALATVELLRARLLYWPDATDSTEQAESSDDTEPGEGMSGSSRATPTTPPVAAEANGTDASAKLSWSAELGPNWLILGGGFPTTIGIYGQLGVRLFHGFTVAARGSAGFTSGSFAIEGGRMEYRLHTGTLHAAYRFSFWQERLELRPAIGLGVARGASTAYPDSTSFVETHTGQWSALGLVQAGIGWRPFDHLVFVADAGVVVMPSTLTFHGPERDPSIGGENSPERSVALPRFGGQASLGLRAEF